MIESKKIGSKDIEVAINALKTKKEDKGVIPSSKKQIVIRDSVANFKGKSLKVNKGLFKNGQNYIYKAGTEWKDIDVFGKKNIVFVESDFN